MQSLQRFLEKLFRNKGQEKSSIPFIHEQINLNAPELKSNSRAEVLKIWEPFKIHLNDSFGLNEEAEFPITKLNIPQASGFKFDLSPFNLKESNYQKLMYFIANQLKEYQYVIKLAEKKSFQKGEDIHMTTTYYLKPSLKLRAEINPSLQKSKQLWGNIILKYSTINDHPNAWLLQANVYQDHQYESPYPFEGLISNMLNW